jgi:alkanesulfonate monooxygenase SsuD/methylene tetrahydromethanopterin reductase-like flavin-dependent oxidoreductase (luciferase family)
MWNDNDGPYVGQHYQLAETICSPKPIQQPAPKVLIGGSGERKIVRLVGQYTDACNLFATGPEETRHKLDVLERHCESAGRDPASIELTILFLGDPLRDVAACWPTWRRSRHSGSTL